MSDPIKQQLIEARKNQILDAATHVFSEKGFHATTTRDIAKTAGISEGTIYNYFGGKLEVLLGIFERMRATVMQPEVPIDVEDLDLRGFLQRLFYYPLVALKANNFALFRITISELAVNEELRTRYMEQTLSFPMETVDQLFKTRLEAEGIESDQVDLIFRIAISMVLGVVMLNVMDDDIIQSHWDALPDLMADTIMNLLRDKTS